METLKNYIPINWSIFLAPSNWILIAAIVVFMILCVRLIMTDDDGTSAIAQAPSQAAYSPQSSDDD